MHGWMVHCLRTVVWAATLAGMTVAWARSANGYTPESPEVKQTVAKALRFLESSKANDQQLGAKALIGLVFVKCGAPPDHPRIVEAVRAIRAVLRDRDPKKVRLDDKQIYHSGLMVMFLLAHDRDAHRADIECVLKYLQLVQKDHGGWGYPSLKTGDTSMTQYGVLSAWEATQGGFRVPEETIRKMSSWLLRTQDPTGGFAYQGTLSPSFVPVQQDTVTLSMSAAGLGSLYICADLLGLIVPPGARVDEDLPPALHEVKDEALTKTTPLAGPIDPKLFREAEARGMGWMGQNYKIDPGQYAYYYLYALERCMSFRELWQAKAEKKAADGPFWYNDGVDFLRKTQAENGSWHQTCGPAPDTAFGVLFLIRSTQKSIRKARNFGDGTLVGGRGLPKETDRARIQDGKVVVRPLVSAADELLAVLEGSEAPDFSRAVDLVAALPPDEAETVVKKHAEKLRSLAGNESPEARMAAVRALSKAGGLDNVPTLIYALTDPDFEIVVAARDGLRRISRNPTGFGLPGRPDKSQLRVAIAQWKAWYLAVRPDAEFDD